MPYYGLLFSLISASSVQAFEFKLQQTIDFNTDLSVQKPLTRADELPIPNFPDLPDIPTVEPDILLLQHSIGDLDGDGDIDILFSERGEKSQVWLNNGQGEFNQRTEAFNFSVSGGYNKPIMLGDIDQDGDLDAIIEKGIVLNDGTGFFDQATLKLTALFPAGLADLNQDGHLDVLGYYFWENNGSGDFTHNNNETGLIFEHASFADIDNDGDIDAWIVDTTINGNIIFSIIFNDGKGNFTETTQIDEFNNSIKADMETADGQLNLANKVALGDIDNDGDIDAIITSYGGEFSQGSFKLEGGENKIWLNNGQGHYTASEHILSEKNFSTDSQLVDIDNDGDLDFLVMEFEVDSFPYNEPEKAKIQATTNGHLTIWLNNGQGDFTKSAKKVAGFSGTKLSVADLNKDGFKDIIVGNQVWLGGVDTENSHLCDWAEKRFPQFFPKNRQDLTFGSWEYRYYPSTKIYIGVETIQDKVYVLGDVFSGLKEIGDKKDMLVLYD